VKARRLRPYQRHALDAGYNALFLDMRLGKTLTALRRVKRERAFPCLFVTPYSNFFDLKLELENEELSYQELTGTKRERLDNLMIDSLVYIINTEGFLVIPEMRLKDWKSVIFDESHKIKNPKARITKYFTKAFRKVPLKMILSGDPAPESYLDYFCQFQFLSTMGCGEAFGCLSYWGYRSKYFTPVDSQGFKWAVTRRGKKYIDKYIKNHAFSLKRVHAGVVSRKKYYRSYLVEMDARTKKLYRELKEKFVIDTDTLYRMTKHKVVQISLMHQLAAGFIEKECVWSGKLDALQKIVSSKASMIQTVIFAQHIHELDAISKILNCRIINGQTKKPDRQRLQKRFQEGKDRILLSQNACLTYGANLSAADRVIYFSNTEEFVIREQTEDRAIRVGSNKQLEIIDILTSGTVDEVIYKSIRNKDTASTLRKNILRSFYDEQ